jgi:deazaflavin-dependent oxidoreductase (nitroreductase family)
LTARTIQEWLIPLGSTTFKAMDAAHRVMLALSRGRYGWSAMNMPVLELTTTGRTSGLPRSVMLPSPIQEGTTLVVVASRGGDDKPPAWLLNIQGDPDVSVVLEGGAARPMRARVATAEERARLWPSVVADHTNYQKRTRREIALVLLEPVG